MQKENAELRVRLKSVEFDLECERANSRRLLEANSPEMIRLKEEVSTLHKRLTEKDKAIAAMEESLRRAKDAAFNGSTASEDTSKLRRKLE